MSFSPKSIKSSSVLFEDCNKMKLIQDYQELKRVRESLEEEAFRVKLKEESFLHTSQKLLSKSKVESQKNQRLNYFKKKSEDFNNEIQEKKINNRINNEVTFNNIKNRKIISQERIKVKKIEHSQKVKERAIKVKSEIKELKEEAIAKKEEFVKSKNVVISQERKVLKEKTNSRLSNFNLTKQKEEIVKQTLIEKILKEEQRKNELLNYVKKAESQNYNSKFDEDSFMQKTNTYTRKLSDTQKDKSLNLSLQQSNSINKISNRLERLSIPRLCTSKIGSKSKLNKVDLK